MGNIIEYLAVKAISTDKLTEFVNMHIEQGYQPFGSIACSALTVDENGKPTNTAIFCQAMVKYA